MAARLRLAGRSDARALRLPPESCSPSFITALARAAPRPDHHSNRGCSSSLILAAIRPDRKSPSSPVQDMLLFSCAWELERFPVYLLVWRSGGPKKRSTLPTEVHPYTAGAPVFILLGALAMGYPAVAAPPTLNTTALAANGIFGTLLSCWPTPALCWIAFGVLKRADRAAANLADLSPTGAEATGARDMLLPASC